MSSGISAGRKWNQSSSGAVSMWNESELFRFFFEQAPEAIVVFDCDARRFVLVNEHATQLFGFTRDELLTLDPAAVSPLVQPDGRTSEEGARDWLRRALAGETPVFEWTHKHSSGRLMTCELRLVRMPGAGRLVRGSIIDITSRKRREKIQRATYEISEAAHDAEDLGELYARIHRVLASLMPANNFYIALLDPQTQLISFPYFVDVNDPVPPEPRKVTTGLTGYVLRTGKSLLIDSERSQRKRPVDGGVMIEGMELPYVESGHPAAIWLGAPLATRGKTFGVMAVQDYYDPTAYAEDEKRVLTFIAAQTALAIERKRSDDALRESEEKFRALFENSGQGVMLHDEKEFLQVNPAALRILRYERAEDIVGKHPAEMSAEFQPNGERADVLAPRYIARCLAEGTAKFEWLAQGADGSEIPLEVILSRVRWRGRQIIQAVINDMTERKKAEAELLKSLAREKELGELKSSFVSMVSHEFRTPLGIIMSSADILLDYFEQLEPDERKRHLDSIHKNTGRMAKLMEEVLLLGKFDAGKMNFEPRELDVRALVQRIVNEVLTATNHRCHTEVSAEKLPVALGDERLLRHVFVNLVSNAVKYSEPGTTVRVSIEHDEEDAVFRIADRGIGIPEADLPWLFNAFHRGRNVGKRAGTGLGLVIAKRCVDLHRGEIHVHSRVGEGTTVTVRLPMFSPSNFSV